jgi:hypothetical protein
MAVIDTGTSTAGKANVDSTFNLQVNTPGFDATGVSRGGGSANAGAVTFFSENDAGTQTGARLVASPETDAELRLRSAVDTVLDIETFNYTAQNTGKHFYSFTTMIGAWTAGGFVTNNANITTTTTGVLLRTFGYFPISGATITYVEATLGFSAANAPTNTLIDCGLFLTSGTNPFAPSDGAYFRVNAAGVFGVVNNNGSETTTSVFSGFSCVANEKYKFAVVVTERLTQFWIDNVLYGSITTPIGFGQPFTSTSLPFAIRHAIVGGAAGAAFQATLSDYSVYLGGPATTSTLSQTNNRNLGAHQGLSGGTMGSLATYANSFAPVSAAGSNTAALVTGLGGQVTLNAAAAAVTDFILTSYQVPVGTALVQGRRLALYGVRVATCNLGAAVATTETTLAYSLAFGHTAVSLATAETGSGVTNTTKAPRREALGMQSWAVGAAIGAPAREGAIFMPFTQPIYVNPGEFIAVAAKFLVGTATASQTIYNHITFDYGWE